MSHSNVVCDWRLASVRTGLLYSSVLFVVCDGASSSSYVVILYIHLNITLPSTQRTADGFNHLACGGLHVYQAYIHKSHRPSRDDEKIPRELASGVTFLYFLPALSATQTPAPMSSFANDDVSNQVAGLFKILNLLLQSRQRDSVSGLASKIEGLVLKSRNCSMAKLCIFQGEQLLLHQPFDDLSNSTGARLLLVGLKLQKTLPAAKNKDYSIHAYDFHNQYLPWLESIRPTNIELIAEVVEAIKWTWQPMGNFRASHPTPAATLADSKESFKHRCLRDCTYLFER